jgi:hypothetical protein
VNRRELVMSVGDRGEGLEYGYSRMAADEQREQVALEWCNTLIGDLPIAAVDETTQHE